jgi:hypothetical protein
VVALQPSLEKITKSAIASDVGRGEVAMVVDDRLRLRHLVIK